MPAARTGDRIDHGHDDTEKRIHTKGKDTAADRGPARCRRYRPKAPAATSDMTHAVDHARTHAAEEVHPGDILVSHAAEYSTVVKGHPFNA